MGKLRLDERRVKVLMAMSGVGSLPDLAKLAGMHYNTVYKMMESGRFSIDSLEALADALNCNPIDLIVTEGYPDPRSVAPGRPLTAQGRGIA